MDIGRILKHLCTGRHKLKKAFPVASFNAIAASIKEAESSHSGEIRFAVEASLDMPELLHGQSARERAIEVFSQLRVWDTELNNGVLIYLLLADRDIEIVADRGIDAKVDHSEWESICRDMEARFKAGEFEQGVVNGIRAIGLQLNAHFPAPAGNANEIPDQPVVL